MPVLEIRADTSLDPAKTYGQIVIKASNVTLDGQGAWLIGATQGAAKTFKRTAISASGVSRVTLRNIKAKGWETGLHVTAGSQWTIENCDFSDNFNDPDFGWGENGRRGGIVLQDVSKSTLRKNRAQHVWDGCALVDSNDNTLEGNDFSHTANTCLQLWNSSRNVVRKNTLTYGLRISRGEVHARDSACVLIESGSNDNRFFDNNCTHGGDGIFIRSLNGWVSTGNLFERNDASFANNNCFEAWSPRNIYRDNKANHGSYGFWLGASDQTVLEGNEASHNGEPSGFHNSPHLPASGHAGIVFMFGPSSHTVVRGNTCAANNGAGIALVGDLDSQGRQWKAFHWIIEQNKIQANRWGIYAKNADWIHIAANEFRDNIRGNVADDGNVTRLDQPADDPRIMRPPQCRLLGPAAAKVGEEVALDASQSKDPQGLPLHYHWDLGDGTTSDAPRIAHRFQEPGFYRVGLTVDNGLLADLGWRDFYVVDDSPELGSEGQAADWGWIDPGSKVRFTDDRDVRIAGNSAIRAEVAPYSGGRVELLFPKTRKAGIDLKNKSQIVLWVKAWNSNSTGWQNSNPVLTLYGEGDRHCTLTPNDDLMSHRSHNEEREGWTRFAVPLAGNARWKRARRSARQAQRDRDRLRFVGKRSLDDLDRWSGGSVNPRCPRDTSRDWRSGRAPRDRGRAE